ncbi:phytanoyl-CoA dioxygenase family protein [Phycisphaera mikurensis]|uniref:Putative dioxygenase n=1 Tax=Phycisphaera mikurensis (strain NBRC 102666 / KCTC 22515 / FYK2301M01) TaxID=1142394 RepID=I0ICR1_PHYMF|nr:phytanoyl-CoA dioxygenase family protein [Phycisphaera mikurensis]MBB6442077.1 ectoine hydroxylase-related dioxygenase (phytanoyl-CoA dioxygenase family) [Phycisphaera mikurensis]BAM03049.1 putative dioxygenase [Phycisphaera mikurensis NBRC 102666]
MPPAATARHADAALTPEQHAAWERDGYVIVRGLWSRAEIDACRERFDDLAANAPDQPPHWEPDRNSSDPLKRYPRVMHPHRIDGLSRAMLLDPRVGAILRRLLGEEPIATQSMFYFKPPGGRGQALHQDNFYLKVAPQTCVAAWTAVDAATPENGGLFVCPGTHGMEVACPEAADAAESFTTDLVRPPAGVVPVPAVLGPGDVLFFNGSVVHGSKPNTTADRWRRSFICHYAPASAEAIGSHYKPCFRFDGREHRGFADATGGGPCGEPFDAAAAAGAA